MEFFLKRTLAPLHSRGSDPISWFPIWELTEGHDSISWFRLETWVDLELLCLHRYSKNLIDSSSVSLGGTPWSVSQGHSLGRQAVLTAALTLLFIIVTTHTCLWPPLRAATHRRAQLLSLCINFSISDNSPPCKVWYTEKSNHKSLQDTREPSQTFLKVTVCPQWEWVFRGFSTANSGLSSYSQREIYLFLRWGNSTPNWGLDSVSRVGSRDGVPVKAIGR